MRRKSKQTEAEYQAHLKAVTAYVREARESLRRKLEETSVQGLTAVMRALDSDRDRPPERSREDDAA